MLGALFTLVAAVTQSLQGAINKKLLETIPSPFLLLSVLTGAMILTSPLILYSGIPQLDATFFIAGFSGATLNAAATLLLWEALKRDNLSRVFPFLTLAPVFSIITALFILDELPSPQGLLGILLIIAGLFTIERQGPATAGNNSSPSRLGPLFAALAALLLSLNVAVDRLAILHSSPFFYPPFFLGTGLVAVFLYTLLKPPAVSTRVLLPRLRIILVSALCLAAGTILTSLALSLTLASYVSAIKRLGVLFALLWGAKFLKEAVGWRLIAGATLATIGAALIALAR